MFIRKPKHPLLVTLTPLQVALSLAELRYDSLAEYLAELAFTLGGDGQKDQAHGRYQIATKLEEARDHLNKASNAIWAAWKIAKKHMEETE
jgi:hypothetical protein